MHENIAKQKLATGQPISVVSTMHGSASLVEFVAQLGFDAIFLDEEHGAGSWEHLENMVRAAELRGATPIVRVQENNASIITRSLDRGAGGIQVPHVNSRADAMAAVRNAKYAPLGDRGWFAGRALYGHALRDYPRYANDETIVVLTLEETRALENLDEILTVDHVDVFFVASGDLAQSMGYPGEPDHPDVRRAVEGAVVRIVAAGKVAGVLVTPATVGHYIELGARYLFIGLGNVLTPGANDFLTRVRQATGASSG